MDPSEKKTIRLYHYLESCWALDDIRRRRLKLSRIADLNDPYEWACVHSSHQETQWALEKTRRDTADSLGLQSFTRDWNSILMWSHYAQKHQGMCLGFDISRELTKAVRYKSQVLRIGSLEELPQKTWEAIIKRLSWTKYKGWSY